MDDDSKELAGKSRRKSFSFIETDAFWRAAGRGLRSGSLYFDKKSQSYWATYPESKIIFPRLAAAGYASEEDCPVDKNHQPKSDFLMLLALRECYPTESPGRQWDPQRWSEIAIRSRIAETEKKKGSPLPESSLENAKRIYQSLSEFEEYAGSWLVRQSQKPDAGKVFSRLARWLEALQRMEELGIPETYQRFFSAVEKAAGNAGGVPTQKAVRVVFEAGMSVNQQGKGDPFRVLMKKLKFNWLPIAGRGPSVSPKKSGI